VAISARRWGRRGTPPIDVAPKRELYLHQSVTSNRRRNRAEERQHMRDLEQAHLARGFLTLGYNFVLFPSGRLYEGRGPHGLPAAQGGHNSGTLAIACVGDYRTDKLTRRMKARLIVAAVNTRLRRGVRLVGGHREAPNLRERTECPAANVMRWLPALARRAGLRRVGREFERAGREQDGSACTEPAGDSSSCTSGRPGRRRSEREPE
jgi:N-acetylmuramoyl-L-alanine amidase